MKSIGHLHEININMVESRVQAVRKIHKDLETQLSFNGKSKRTFFDQNPVAAITKPDANEDIAAQFNRLKKETEEMLKGETPFKLTSLDITVYAYLREELVNDGPTSSNGNDLRKNCPNLMHFFFLMENIFGHDVEDYGVHVEKSHGSLDHKNDSWYKSFKKANDLKWEPISES